ncbi:MAG: sugar transferase [Rhodobacteraceae bacterium]|nr:sugar transferase [Paracoccaceae bacterium]
MTWKKRLFDLFFASILAVILAPVTIFLLILLWVKQGRPLFFVSERMKKPDQPFQLWKLRTMTVVTEDSGISGGDKKSRVTSAGAWLRSKRLDELPQIWNILRGDMSFVGPRPPLRQYVEAYPELYNEVLRSRPGVTGLATLVFNKHETALLDRCETLEETDKVYRRVCIPRKARLDLIYQDLQSTCYDFVLVFETVGNLFLRK